MRATHVLQISLSHGTLGRSEEVGFGGGLMMSSVRECARGTRHPYSSQTFGKVLCCMGGSFLDGKNDAQIVIVEVHFLLSILPRIHHSI